MSRFGLPTNLTQYEAVKGGFDPVQPGVYLGKITEVNPDYKAGTGTPAVEISLDVLQGTTQSDGTSPAGKKQIHRIWLPKPGESDQDKIKRAYGGLRYFLEDCMGIPAHVGEFDTEDLKGKELTFKIRMGKPQPKYDGRRFTEVAYIRPATEFANEFASFPEISPGIPADAPASSAPAASVAENSAYSGDY
jgi:hypothetical protein